MPCSTSALTLVSWGSGCGLRRAARPTAGGARLARERRRGAHRPPAVHFGPPRRSHAREVHVARPLLGEREVDAAAVRTPAHVARIAIEARPRLPAAALAADH